ncbi:MAG: hypothetical protein ACO3C1_09455 [Ilumatobacteraceae bacterium]
MSNEAVTRVSHPSRVVARVVPDVSGLDKQFDYLVPDDLVGTVDVGSLVRVPLHGRRVGGWVVHLTDEHGAGVDAARLVPITKWSSVGPSPELVDLAAWAAVRWGTARIRPFLGTASPPSMVPRLPPRRRRDTAGHAPPSKSVRCLGPFTDPLPIVLEAAGRGPTIAVHPSPRAARALAVRLRREGLSVAVLPDDWAAAAGGVDVVVGSRSAAWAPCPGLAAVVVLDEHDEAYQEERSPTWHARDVLVERAQRSGASCVLVSPCPTVAALEWSAGNVVHSGGEWPAIEVDDRADVEPWRRSIVGSRLIELLRDPSRRVVCVLNTTGRARILACRSCRALQRCEHCAAAVAQPDEGLLGCPRCGRSRPVVCQRCGATAMAIVRPGVTRLRDELEAAAGRPVELVTGDSAAREGELATAQGADVLVGTEAVLHRAGRADVVAFLDVDAELFAPRYRATEHVVALVVRAGRLVGRAAQGGLVLLQTHDPDHEVIRALVLGDVSAISTLDAARRRALSLPPFAALASLEGTGARDVAAASGLEWAPTPKGALARASTWGELGTALAATPRPRESSVRVEVDPPRA